MGLSKHDRVFIQAVDRLKIFLIVMASLILIFLLLTPPTQIQLATTILAIALCGVFFITQKLLTFISDLDFEVTKLRNMVKESLTDEQRSRLFPDSK